MKERKRPARTAGARPAAARPRRRGGGHARRPRPALRARLGRRLPSRGRALAVLLLLVLAGGLTAAVSGPWLRVQQVAHAGTRFAPVAALEELLAGYGGAPLLAVDTRQLAARVAELPAVAEAKVEARLPNALSVTVTEKEPALTWRTRAAILVGAADGSVIAELPLDAELAPELAALPAIVDERSASRRLTVGDALPAVELDMARRLRALEPELLGSGARSLSVRLNDEHGFVLVCPDGGWEAALGVYGLDPRAGPGEAEALLQRQVAAIRTLFSVHPEGSVSWLDARNPGKVYWAP